MREILQPEKKRVAAVVVLFNPSSAVLANIESYRTQVEHVFAIDNSVATHKAIEDAIVSSGGVSLHKHGANLGIAAALNTGAQLALGHGYDLLLTMDQDTLLDPGYVERLYAGFLRNGDQTGIIAPRYGVPTEAPPKDEHVLFTMTSGNLLNLHAYRETGPFMTELFIDHVDHEYCLRLQRRKFHIIQDNSLQLKHRPGHLINLRLLGKNLAISTHSPTRLYYFCRNGFFVSRQYRADFPGFKRSFLRLLVKELLKAIVVSDRWQRLRMIRLAYRHFLAGKLGEYEDNSHERD